MLSVYAKKGMYKVGDSFHNNYTVVHVGDKVFSINKAVPCKTFPRSRNLGVGLYVSIKIKKNK